MLRLKGYRRAERRGMEQDIRQEELRAKYSEVKLRSNVLPVD